MKENTATKTREFLDEKMQESVTDTKLVFTLVFLVCARNFSLVTKAFQVPVTSF